MSKYHYVYRITNTKENKHYYGVRSSKVEPKLDLGVKYFSSSRDKEFIKKQKENKSIFKYKIIKQFDSRKEAVKLEIKLHSKFDVGVNESFYNRVKQTSTGFDVTGTTYSHTEETKEKMSISRRGVLHYNYGKTHSDETKQKMSLSLSGRVFSEEHIENLKISAKNKPPVTTETKQKMSIAKTGENHFLFGKKHSEETIQKMRKPRPQVYITCPHCGKNGGTSNMKRYHFDNCKSKI